jgi:hypothetical protein
MLTVSRRMPVVASRRAASPSTDDVLVADELVRDA